MYGTGLSGVLMEVNIDPELLRLIATLEEDISKVVQQALTLWLKKRILTCPITNRFCIDRSKSCNECAIAKNAHAPQTT